MGNDGGSIPKRRELVKSAARNPTVSELKATALEALTHAWQTDPISGSPLDLDAVVSNWRGRLFNYETVLEGLLPSADKTEGKEEPQGEEASTASPLTVATAGIRSVRDVVRLQCGRSKRHGVGWQCPITLKELGPNTKAIYLVPCGHVFAEAAVDTILPDKQCPDCSTAFTEESVIPILPTDETELARLRQRIERLQAEGLSHNLKKDKSHSSGEKKHKSKKRKAGEDGSKYKSDRATEDPAGPKKKKEKTHETSKSKIADRVSGINNPLAAKLTAQVLAEQNELKKRRKMTEIR